MALLPWKRAVPESGIETSAFEDLALPLLPALYNVAFWLARNARDAEDLVQETFLKALRGFTAFEPGSNFRAWIFRILRNTYSRRLLGPTIRGMLLRGELRHFPDFCELAETLEGGFFLRKNPLGDCGFGLH
jgi:DNA-directed RNA polymerase specialized sigma24 family protein